MRLLSGILLVLFLSSNSFAGHKIEVFSVNKKDDFQGYQFSVPDQEITKVDLDLGENLSSKTIRISSEKPSIYRVHVQLETSLTIMDEGPHLDLINWKHCTTEWMEVDESSGTEFILPELEKIDVNCFPVVTAAEIRDEALEQGGQRWAKLIGKDATINDYPIGVSLSTVRIKIEEKTDDKWKIITVLDFSIPMGC